MKHSGFAVAIILPACLMACGQRSKPDSTGELVKDAAPEQHQQASAIDERFTRDVLEVAAQYQTWGRVSDHADWAPWMCRAPVISKLLTHSKDIDTHGQKLYYLFAKDAGSYLGEGYWPMPGETFSQNDKAALTQVSFRQAVVKQSWSAEAVEPGTMRYREASEIIQGHDGRAYTPGSPGPLFVMLKKDPGTPGTDEGWVYATLTPDGCTITGMGRMESCMGCHTKAPKDRLFGLKPERGGSPTGSALVPGGQ